MPLPSIVMPSTVPDWRLAPHDVSLPSPYAVVQFVTGHSRQRRVALSAARQLQAGLLMNETQALALHAWFEDDLQAGTLPFAARVLGDDGTRQWWHARFAEPPVWECVATSGGPHWQLAATLRLEGEPSLTAPA